jgi:phosphoribosylglycinamide formyltransferase-1
MKRIVILASGSGSNAQKIIEYFEGHPSIEVALVLANKRTAGVLDRCDRLGIPAFYFNPAAFGSSNRLLECLKGLNPDLVVLAGFLKLIPKSWLDAFPKKIINIHPALLPKYGGKGMFGMNVHRKVKEEGEKESGISIHYVDARYDEGAMIKQFTCALNKEDTPEQIAAKVQRLEHVHYPQVIESILLQ